MEKVFEIYIKTTPDRLWQAITDGEMRARYNFGVGVESDWTPGSTYQGVHRAAGLTITEGENVEVDPPRRLAFSWAGSGDVSIELEPRGDRALLTLIHRRASDRATLLGVSAGWHSHLDVLAARLEGVEPRPFWDAFRQLRAEYETRLPG